MKAIPFQLLITGLFLPVLCYAQPKLQQGGSPPKVVQEHHGAPPRGFMNGWEAADKDHDGFISKEEFEAMPRIANLPQDKRDKIFKRLDKNGDGKISREEIGMLAKHRMQRFWDLDTDHSGGVSFEEFQAGEFYKKLPLEKQKEIFNRLDSNGDGLITREDHPQLRFVYPNEQGRDKGNMKKFLTHLIEKFDIDGDGSLSFAEFRLIPWVKNLTEAEQKAHFDKLDRNHDQKISPEDFPPSPSPPDGQTAPSSQEPGQ
jgi:Ca2+-binding EF-hand superfamily protein